MSADNTSGRPLCPRLYGSEYFRFFYALHIISGDAGVKAATGGGRASQRRRTAVTSASHTATSAEDTNAEYIRSLPAQVNAVRASSSRRSVQTDSLDTMLDTLSRRIGDIVDKKIYSVLSANGVVNATTVD